VVGVGLQVCTGVLLAGVLAEALLTATTAKRAMIIRLRIARGRRTLILTTLLVGRIG